jgi:predicted metal-dependent RNase
LHDLIRNELLPRQPIYISGLANSYNEIYDELANAHPRVCPGFKLEKNLDLIVLEQREVAKMALGKGKLLLLSSGMMTPHTTSYKMAVRMAHDPKHSIFFVGYVDPDSPAGKIKAAGHGGQADMGGDVRMLDLQCRIDSFDLTSHCNREHMLDYVMRVRPHQVLLVHGEMTSLQWFEQEIKKNIPECKVTIPPSGETIELS